MTRKMKVPDFGWQQRRERAIELYFVQGVGVAEIAERLDIHKDTVRKYLRNHEVG